jgi:DNA-binding NarL/FixJ family response regulator
MDSRCPVTVVLARFEDLIGAGLRSLIGADPSLCIVACDVEVDRLGEVIVEYEPTVTIVNLAALDALGEIRRLHADHPGTRIIVLANRPTLGECNQLLALGATACLGKEVEGRDVLNAIHLASRGLHVLPHAIPANGGAGVLPDILTPREANVLDQLRLGRTNGEIAVALSVSVETVRTHARSVFRKLGVRSRRELSSPGR